MLSARSVRRFSGVSLFSVLWLLASTSYAADVSFPANPQTRAECEGPAAQMLAMEQNEFGLAAQARKDIDALPYESMVCRGNDCVRPTTDPIRAQLFAEVRKHRDEGTRIGKERAELERICRAAATENERAKQDEANSIAAKFRELKERYEEAKRAYEVAKELYLKPPAELAQDAMNRATGGAADDAVASAYRRRNDAYSASLEAAMNDAKRKTVDLVRRSELVASIQDASFGQFKSQVHQLAGDMNQLEANVQSMVNSPSPAPSTPTVADSPPAESAGNSVASFFRNAIKDVSDKVKEVTEAIQASVDKPASAAAGPTPTVAAPTPAVAARPLTAGEQCVATEDNCQQGCIALGAVGGLLSLFSNSAAGVGATGDQMQKCSDRCTATKSSCDQEIASAERARANPPAVAVAQPSVGQAGGGQGAAGNCAPDPALFQRYVETMDDWARVIKRPAMPASYHAEQFRKTRESHLNWSDKMVEEQIEVQSRPFSSRSAAAPHIAAQSKIFVQMLKCEQGQRLARANQPNPVAASGGGGRVCDVSFDQMFGTFSKTLNPQKPGWGMRDTYQYSYFLGTEGLEMLKKQQSCMSAADYSANYEALKGMRDNGRAGCIKTSSDGGANCKPRYPG